MIKGIIFDMDGTLVDTIGGISYCCNYVLKKHGYPTHDIQAYNEFVGHGLNITLEKSLHASGIHLGQSEFQSLFDEFYAFYYENPIEGTQLFDGFIDIMDYLEKKKIPWAVHTNKPNHIANLISDAYIKPLAYKMYVGTIGPDEKIRKKPELDGAVFHIQNFAQSKEEKLLPYECLYVGDSEVDVETANRLGAISVCVSWGFRKREFLESLNHDVLLDERIQLLQYIKQNAQ